MAQTIGFVVETQDDGWATVVAEKGQGCGSCTAVSACHTGRAGDARKTRALNRVGAAVGDRVTLTVASSVLLSRLALLYLLPVAAMLIGAFVGNAWDGDAAGPGGGLSIGLGVAGFVLGLLFSVALSRLWSAARPVVPEITRVVNLRLRASTPPPASGCGCAGH